MINYDHIMVRFGELSTKGKNKKDFIMQLYKNIKHALKEFSSLGFILKYDHIYIKLNDENCDEVTKRLQEVSGIHSLSFVYKCDKDIEVIKSSCLELIKIEKGSTFKVACKRSDKRFPLISEQIVRMVAPVILKNTSLRVDVHNPDILLSIEIRDEACYIFSHTVQGAGGYPLGVGGKALMMLSGGIDSPVAAYLLMKRGVKIECIHFASPPYTQQAVIYKLEDLLKKLNFYQESIRLNIIPFTKLQEAIYQNVDESYCITIMRRMMYRIAEIVAKRRKCLAIASGESVGQVASQTLASIKTINNVTNYPVIRPLAVTDKLEIMSIAQRIGTYEISIRPYEDCCTIFAPKAPKTQPQLDECEYLENKFDWQTLLNEAVNNIEVKIIGEEKR